MDCSHSADVLGQTLAQLPVLTRLNLNKIGLTNQLDIVLSKMSASLRDLQLRYCGVSEKDITFLTNSQHASTLEALDISYNNVGNYFEEFVLLLSALKNQLVILQTVNCSFQQDHLTHLLRITSKNLCHLRLWDISHNCPPTTMDAFIQDLTALAEAVSLEKLLVSFPEELGSIDGASIVESPTGKFRQDFHETVMNRLSKLFGKASRLGVEVVMVKNSDKKFGQ